MSIKIDFLRELHHKIAEQQTDIQTRFLPLALEQLNWQPAPTEWSILQCFEHLNLTHDYYRAKIDPFFVHPNQPATQTDKYTPSFWGRIYMHFALNPNYTFPSPDEVVPAQALDKIVFEQFFQRQAALVNLLEQAETLPVSQMRVPIESFVTFNVGDCLKVLVYHDALHIHQAGCVLKQLA